MASLDGELWRFNFVNLVMVDVSDDYRYLLEPLPSECYPVIKQQLVPAVVANRHLPASIEADGFLYDWHEPSSDAFDDWYVGMVRADLTVDLP
jgi:hypothetical protein